ncbi:MAG: FtsX-like permease family protein [Candidatus Solibacter usitatus]|nr:FtsX-like permease family protein [Candidatus Solibacter usitatus]
MNARTAFKIAWRESRASSAKFLFVILAVATGVGSLTGVRGFSRAFHDLLLREARTLMAADLSVRSFAIASPEQAAAMQTMERSGVRRTWITETLSMVSSGPVANPLLVSIKAVDPNVYPFYGAVKLDPPGALAEKLTADTVAVSEDLLLRLKIRVGDSVRLGGQDFRIVAVVATEPDRMTGSLNVGPRVMITRQGLDRTGLMSVGSRASERYLFRLAPGSPGIEELRATLKKVFPDALITDFRETHPTITQGLNRATTFLSLVSLIALIVGALGVATAIHAHLQQKMDSIAVMKCLGARSREIVKIYALQTLGLGLAGGLIGIAVGAVVQAIFPVLIARYFHLTPQRHWDLLTSGQGLGIGVLTALLFTLPPLLGIKRIRPGVIFRREMAESKPKWRERLRDQRSSIVAGACILAGIGLIAGWLTIGPPRDAVRTGLYFTGALMASLAVLSTVAWLLLHGVRAFVRRSPWKLPATLRHGIANLYRPGNHAQAALVALGIGVMFTLTVYLVQRGMLTQMFKSTPPGMPNVFLLDITAQERDAMLALLHSQKGVVGQPEVVGTVQAKLVTIDNTPIENIPLQGWGKRFQHPRSVTSAAEKPVYADVIEGAWWDPKKPAAEPEVAVSEEGAHALKLHPGAHLTWTVAGRTITARVACIQRIDSIHMNGRIEFIFRQGMLDGLPVIYYGSVRMEPRAVAALQRASYERFPTVTVINVADVLEIVQQVVDQIALVVRFISAFAILAGAVILASSVAGTRFRRVREVVILKTLGATRGRVAGIFSVEFLVLGTVAGIMGSVLASAFSALVLKRLLDAEFHLDLLPNLICIVATGLIANIAGWLASFRILGQKPLEVLRHQ